MLNYERLDVYRCSIEFLALATAIVERLGRRDSALKDQLKRAALSIPLNIAESSGKVFPNDRARFLAIARGSAMECGACLDCLKVMNPSFGGQVDDAKAIIVRLVEMLSKMCRPTL
jgi:four helix bundle protein